MRSPFFSSFPLALLFFVIPAMGMADPIASEETPPTSAPSPEIQQEAPAAILEEEEPAPAQAQEGVESKQAVAPKQEERTPPAEETKVEPSVGPPPLTVELEAAEGEEQEMGPALTPASGSAEGWDVAANDDDKGNLRLLEDARLEVGGMIQAWAIPYLGEDHTLVGNLDPADFPGFRLRRARLSATGSLSRMTSFGLTLDLRDEHSNGDFLHDAYVAIHLAREMNLYFGVQRVPFIYQDVISSQYMQFADRPHSVRLLSDSLDMGVSLRGEVAHFLSYRVGIFNGTGRFTSGDINPGYLYAGRLEIHPFGHLGDEESDLDGGDLRIALGFGALYNDGPSTERMGYAGDFRLKWNGFSASAGLMFDRRKPISEPLQVEGILGKVDRLGWHAQMGYVILMPYLEVVARLDNIDDNLDVGDLGDARFYTVGLNLYNEPHNLKTMLHYIHRQELEGPSMDNDALILSVQAAF